MLMGGNRILLSLAANETLVAQSSSTQKVVLGSLISPFLSAFHFSSSVFNFPACMNCLTFCKSVVFFARPKCRYSIACMSKLTTSSSWNYRRWKKVSRQLIRTLVRQYSCRTKWCNETTARSLIYPHRCERPHPEWAKCLVATTKTFDGLAPSR